MEPEKKQPQSLPGGMKSLPDGQFDPRKQLPPGANKVERIAQHTKGLVEDVKTWVDLRIQLVQLELEEKIEQKANQALTGAIMGVLAFLALVFGLTALALGLGAWLGHPAWGFLIVTGLLVLAVVLLQAIKPRLVQRRKPKKLNKGPDNTDHGPRA